MTIKVGDKIPPATLAEATEEGPREITTQDLFGMKTVVLFAVPGAFTPTCHARHLPNFLQYADALKEKGVDIIACISVNDAFVMAAWGKSQNVGTKIMMLADGNADFTKALGLDFDASAFGMGIRSKRYAMLVVDGVVKALNVEKAGGFEVSGAQPILDVL